MTALKLIQLALGLMRLANWISARIDRAEWKRSGYQEAAAEQMREFERSVGIADEAVKQAAAATPEQRRSILEGDL